MTLPKPPQDPRAWKVYPRNLTARADYIVPGNPVTTRTEDGVDNCYPGLELDAKNIHKYFFPGLYFDVYRMQGARLSGLLPADLAQRWLDLGLKRQDLDDNLYLWGIAGRNNALSGEAVALLKNFAGQQGLYAWRVINSLLPGQVGVAVGPDPAAEGQALNAAMKALGAGDTRIERNDKGKVAWMALVAERAAYLDVQGVLDPDVYEPGELTRTLCTPWTYDFRDCQCFYWASNKPDVVSSEDGRYEYLNFQRKNRDVEPQTQDIAYGYAARRAREIDYSGMMEDWEQLRPVLNGREFGETYVPPAWPEGRRMDLERIRSELSYLATVEHALAVQYLYAYYSVDVPREQPDSSDIRTFRLWHAAQTVFEIAIDEMRHFRWANEILKLIGAPTTAKRATMLGRNFRVPFYLQSLSSPQLQWFIDVERPSRSTLVGLDGMYVGILHSLQQLTDKELDPEKRRLAVETVKLIVDEGEGHYERFSVAQQNFAFYDEAGRGELPSYIRKGGWQAETPPKNPAIPYAQLYGAPSPAPPGTEAAGLQEQSDHHYQALVMLLKISFAIADPRQSGQALSQAIGLMFLMNSVNSDLATLQATPLFTLPEGWEQEPPVKSVDDAMALLSRVSDLMRTEPPVPQVLKTAAPSAGIRPREPREMEPEKIIASFRDIIKQATFTG